MAAANEQVQGLQALLDSMQSLPLALQKNLIARALRAGAQPIVDRAVELAPDDPSTSGSRIKENTIEKIVEQTADGARAVIGTMPWNFIGRFSETGTAYQPARPYLRPAFDEKVSAALNIIGESLAEGIEREFLKR